MCPIIGDLQKALDQLDLSWATRHQQLMSEKILGPWFSWGLE